VSCLRPWPSSRRLSIATLVRESRSRRINSKDERFGRSTRWTLEVSPKPLTFTRGRTLYAQFDCVTLAPLVLPRLLARDWPELDSSGTVSLFHDDRALRPATIYSRSRPRDIAGSGFPPLPKIPHCCRLNVGALSQSPCGRSSAKIGKGSSAWDAFTVPTT
jgi:hypothetical protein